MINKIIFTVTPIYSIPPKSAAAVESWMYNVARRINIENKIVCICNEGYSRYSYINNNCSIERIKFSKIYTRLFKKWTRLDPYSYADRILKVAHSFFEKQEDSIIFVHNNLKLFKKIVKKKGYENVVLHMHNCFEPVGLPEDIKLIVPSHFMANWFNQRLPNAQIEVVRNGFDKDIYQQKSEISRDNLNISSRDKVILFAGRIVQDKGVLELIQACHLLFKNKSNYKLVIVGDISAAIKGKDAIYIQKVMEYAAKLGEKCIFTGSVHPEKIRHYYAIADLIAVPSIAHEPFCMVALEAMASGLPVIVSSRGAMIEFVTHNKTGFIFREPLIPESMSQDLEKALLSENRFEIATQARNYAYENFTWEMVTEELQSVINKWYS